MLLILWISFKSLFDSISLGDLFLDQLILLLFVSLSKLFTFLDDVVHICFGVFSLNHVRWFSLSVNKTIFSQEDVFQFFLIFLLSFNLFFSFFD